MFGVSNCLRYNLLLEMAAYEFQSCTMTVQDLRQKCLYIVCWFLKVTVSDDSNKSIWECIVRSSCVGYLLYKK